MPCGQSLDSVITMRILNSFLAIGPCERYKFVLDYIGMNDHAHSCLLKSLLES